MLGTPKTRRHLGSQIASAGYQDCETRPYLVGLLQVAYRIILNYLNRWCCDLLWTWVQGVAAANSADTLNEADYDVYASTPRDVKASETCHELTSGFQCADSVVPIRRDCDNANVVLWAD